jgi:heme/copper-type cytochrome/quinol oxidase subunit 2
MLYKLLKIDDTSKRSAIKVSIFNLILTFIITLVLNIMVYFIFQWYDESTAKPVSRLVWVEVCLNVFFFPFAILLIMGIRKVSHLLLRCRHFKHVRNFRTNTSGSEYGSKLRWCKHRTYFY